MEMSRDSVVRKAQVAMNGYGGPLFKCKRCGATGDPYDGFCRKCGYLLPPREMAQRAEELLEAEMRRKTHRDIKGFAYVRGVGRIDLDVGKRGQGPGMDYGSGLVKLLQKHKEDMKGVPWTFTVGRVASHEDEEKLVMLHDGYLGVLGKRPKGATIVSLQKRPKKAASYEDRR